MNIGDYFRQAACAADELFIEATGRPLTHLSTGSHLKAFYEIPTGSGPQLFGIDNLDEMKIELGYNSTLNKLKKLPAIKDIFVDCLGGSWVVINRHRNDDMVRGQNRLVLTVHRYQESVTTL